MEAPADTEPHLLDASKRLAHQVLVAGENRMNLFLVEVQEERDQIFRAFALSVGLAIFSVLAGVALTALVALVCCLWSPAAAAVALAILMAAYGSLAGFLYAQLARLRRDWESFSATCNELRKDRECLEKNPN
jgi:uncharacterized membrane protein YqjE